MERTTQQEGRRDGIPRQQRRRRRVCIVEAYPCTDVSGSGGPERRPRGGGGSGNGGPEGRPWDNGCGVIPERGLHDATAKAWSTGRGAPPAAASAATEA